MNPFLFASALAIASAVILLWVATNAMREHGSIRVFLPIFMIAMAACVNGTLYFYQLLLSVWHIGFSLLLLSGMVWYLLEYLAMIQE